MILAFYEENKYNLDIIGSIIYYLFNKKHQLIVYNDKDKMNTLKYYKNIFNFKIKSTNEINNDIENIDYIYIGNSNMINNIDINIFKKYEYKFIFISKYYLLPIHNFIKFNNNNINNKNRYILVGDFKNNIEHIYILKNILEKYNSYNFEIIILAKYERDISNEIIKYSKIYHTHLKIFFSLSYIEVEKIILKTKFVISLFQNNENIDLIYYIILAYNYNIPLILHKNISNNFNIKNYIEYNDIIYNIPDFILDITNEYYKKLLLNLINEKDELINKNNDILFNIS